MKLSKRERQKLKETSQDIPQVEHSPTLTPSTSNSSEKRKFHKKHIILGLLGIFIIGIAAYSVSVYSRAGYYDEFAKCLTGEGVEVYGALNWCKYTQGQKAMFGKSFNFLNYKEFTEFPEEQFGKIKKTPTWIINGKVYENVLSFDRLTELTGCKI